MSIVKTSYELACERIIAGRKNYSFLKDSEDNSENDSEKIDMDFIPIAEFSDRADKVIESTGFTDEINKEEDMIPKIRIQESKTYYPDDKVLEVHYNGAFTDYTGFGRLNRAMVFGLSNRNVKVKIEMEPQAVHINQSTQDELKILANNDISPNAPKIFSATVPITGINHTGKRILYTMIETSETIHNDYRDRLNLFDEIWVPTEYGKRVLLANNVHPPIFVMPLGVDETRYKPNAGVMSFGDLKKFKFLSVFRWSYRKGVDVLLRAYMEEFSSNEDVSLLLVSRAIEQHDDSKNISIIMDDFNSIRELVSKKDDDLPHVALYTKPIPERNMPKVYGSANAFCLLTRGEGFSLPICEAGATGIPVIVSNCSAQTDFVNKDNAYLVEPDGYVKAELNGKLSKMAKLCRFYEGQTFPDLGEKSIKQAKEHMRYIYENYQEAKNKALKLRKLMISSYTWTMAVDKVYNRIREIGGK